MGPHAGPHLPRLATRRVVSRDAGHARRGCARSESAPRRGPAHLPADPPVSSPAVVRRAARRQRAAAAPLLGTELRRLPAVQCARVAGPACAQGLVPALQRAVPRRLGRLRVVCVRDVRERNGGQSEPLRAVPAGSAPPALPAPATLRAGTPRRVRPAPHTGTPIDRDRGRITTTVPHDASTEASPSVNETPTLHNGDVSSQ